MVSQRSRECYEKNESTKRHKKRKIHIGVIILVLVLALGTGTVVYVVNQVAGVRMHASGIKTGIKTVAQCLMDRNPDAAEEAMCGVERHTHEIRQALDGRLWKLASSVPYVQSEFHSVDVLLDSVDAAMEDLIRPVIDIMRTLPPESLKQENGWNVDGVIQYLTLAQNLIPRADGLIKQLNNLELGLLDSDGKIHGMLQSASVLAELAGMASNKLLQPTIKQLVEVPPEYLRKEGGVDWDVACNYLEFAQAMIPQFEEIVSSVDPAMLGQNERIAAAIDSVMALTYIFEDAVDTLLAPAVAQLREYPLDRLTVDGGFNVAMIRSYLDFTDLYIPELERTLVKIRDLNLDIFKNEEVASYFEKAWNVTVLYHQNEELISFAKAFLGDGEDRVYLLAAQNSAEIRASGGFPGAMGTIHIRDGRLEVGDFSGVNDVLAVRADAPVSKIENVLFQGAMGVSRDADYCPDFERVAEIWSLGYEKKNKETLDGVISLTPSVIQKILGIVGDITLSDGTVLTGENATRALQRDIYFKYFGIKNDVTKSNAIVDALFAETAKETMRMVTSNISVSALVRYLDILHEGCADRTIMAWMKEPTEQELVRNLGLSGGLNSDPENPAAGIYFSCTVPSKMGWFLNMDIEIGEPEINEDGSRTYPMRVVLENTMTPEELAAGNYYIDGGQKYLGGALYLFAPAGGTVCDFSSSENIRIVHREYHGLQLGHISKINLYYGKPLVITYRLTTAPGVETPLVISQTPTLQAYR